MKIKISWLLFMLCLPCVMYGQKFDYEATIPPITESAYYKITLSPELLGKLRRGQQDLRIYDNSGNEQSYILSQESAISKTSLFVEYKIIEKKFGKNAISYLTFHNPNKDAIDNVSFIIKNTDVQKRARLSGSDDKKNWYIIKDDYLLHAMQSTDSISELKVLNFPSSNYQYFRLEINDRRELPINILKVGYYDHQKTLGVSTSFDCPIVYQEDSLKKSFLKLDLSELKYFEKLNFELTGAEYYSRYAQIQTKHERINRKKKKEVFFNTIASTEFNSNSRNEINLGSQSDNEIYIEIHNKDNQPLRVTKVTASYLNQYALVKLEPQKGYRIMFGNENLRAPEYDLKNFADEVLPGATKINHNAIGSLKVTETLDDKASSIFESTYFIWGVILVVGAVLGFVSLKMIKEIK